MAHKKGAGSTKNGRDSISKRLGVKIFGNQAVTTGEVIVRQRGTKFHAGKGVGRGVDNTLFALKEGIVKYATHKAYFPRVTKKTFVSVEQNSSFKN